MNQTIMYRPVLVTAPTLTPVSIDEVKLHCLRGDLTNDHNATLTVLIGAAASYLDGWTGILGRCLVEQTWRQDFDCFWRSFRLPLYPVISITSLKYDDVDGVEQTVSSANYRLLDDDLGSYVKLVDDYDTPSIQSDGGSPHVRIVYKAGYANIGAATTVPDAIKSAMLLLIEHWFNNRSAVVVGGINSASATALPFAVDALLAPFRRVKF